MRGSNKILIVIVAIIGIIALLGFTTYNSLVNLDETTNQQYANIESKLQRRYDLIPNLVNSVKGAMKQEQEVFSNIADARSKMAGATSVNEKVNASNELEGAIGRLLVVMENYPQLKSNENVTKLMDELAGTENRISVERDRYNEAIREYNKKIKRFPSNIFANMFGFESKDYFKANPQAQQAPNVNL